VGTDVTELSGLAQAWPGWHLWHSRRGELACATRRQPLTSEEVWRGLSRTLIENDVPTLVAKLQEQEAKRRAYAPLTR
jgi:hypothetical protein